MKKHVIVTGASRGIGFQLVKKFVENGFGVLALSRNIIPLKTLQLQYDNLSALAVDICKEKDLKKVTDFVSKKGNKVDILINNAGKLIKKPFVEISTSEFAEVYKVNVLAVAALTQKLIPYFQKKAHVVNISSMGGVQGSSKFAGLSAYSSSKAALIALTEVLAEEYKETGLSFNTLALGAVQTEMLQEAFPGYTAPLTAEAMASYIYDFSLSGNTFYNGKVLPVAVSTP